MHENGTNDNSVDFALAALESCLHFISWNTNSLCFDTLRFEPNWWGKSASTHFTCVDSHETFSFGASLSMKYISTDWMMTSGTGEPGAVH